LCVISSSVSSNRQGTTFTHDGRNRLIKAVKGEATTLVYDYAVSGYRIQSIKKPTGVDAAGKATGGLRTRYVLSGSEEVADIDANKNVIARYVPGPAIDERVAQVDANGAVYYIHTDRQNSVIALSDLAGNVTHRRGYGTFGETAPTQMTGEGAHSHPFGYTGRRWEGDLGLYYYRARWYDPELGTFLQTDPIGSLDYINLYAYVGAEPGNGTDPSGMDSRGRPRVIVGSPNGSTPTSYPKTGFGSTGQGSNGLPPDDRVRTSPNPGGRIIFGVTRGNLLGGLVTVVTTAHANTDRIGLERQLGSEQQFQQIASGGGEVFAGSGTGVTFRDEGLVIANYGGQPGDWVKVKSSSYRDSGGFAFETHAVRNRVTGQVVEPKVKIDSTRTYPTLGGK
jgi:RHS repeat-associated protein